MCVGHRDYFYQLAAWWTNWGCIFTKLIIAEDHMHHNVQWLSFHICMVWITILSITFQVYFDAVIAGEVFLKVLYEQKIVI